MTSIWLMLSVTLLAAASCPRPHAGHMLTTCWSHADHMLVSCRPPPRHMRHMLHHRPALARALLAHTKHAHSKPYARRLHKTRHSIASHKCAHSKAYMRFSPARPAQPPHMSRTQQRNSAPCKLTPFGNLLRWRLQNSCNPPLARTSSRGRNRRCTFGYVISLFPQPDQRRIHTHNSQQ